MTPAIGYAIREQNRPILSDPSINAAEITFERADDSTPAWTSTSATWSSTSSACMH